MSMAPDRTVVAILDALIAQLMTEDAPWDAILGRMGWTAAEITEAQDDFRKRPPRVKEAYPRKDDRWPVWTVFLDDESPEAVYAGNTAEAELDGDDALEVHGVEAQQKVSILVFTENSQRTREHYELVFAAMVSLPLGAISGQTWLSGGGLRLNQEYYPAGVWARVQSWGFSYSKRMVKAQDGVLVLEPVYAAVVGHDAGPDIPGAVDLMPE